MPEAFSHADFDVEVIDTGLWRTAGLVDLKTGCIMKPELAGARRQFGSASRPFRLIKQRAINVAHAVGIWEHEELSRKCKREFAASLSLRT